MPLIMISAMYENGGNTTHRMLDGHPELFVYPFESQVGTGQVNDYLTSFVPIRYRWPEFGLDGQPEQDYEAFWDEELKTYLRVRSRSKFRDCGLQMDEAERKREFVAYLQGKPRTRRNLVLAFYHSTFATWRNLNRTGAEKWFVGYNPVQVFDYPKIFADFPDGHMIHVVRHPFGGYADTKKRPFPISLERYGWTWNHCQHMALVAAGQFPDRFHILRFEDLVAGPKAALEPIFAKIGLKWSDKCLAPTFNAESMGEIAPWGTIKTPTTEANLATRNELSADEKTRMTGVTRVMFDLIYGRDGDTRGSARG
jgi:hypothetical protein